MNHQKLNSSPKQLKRILIGIITDRFPYPEFNRSLFRNIVQDIFEIFKLGYILDYADMIGMPRHQSREQITKLFMESASPQPDDRLLFLDTDMTFPDHTILTLLKNDLQVVGGFYVKRLTPQSSLVLDYSHMENDIPIYNSREDVELDNLYKCDATGAGCLMIKRSALKKISPPFFTHMPPYQDCSEEMKLFHDFMNNGTDVYVDTHVNCGHAFISFTDYNTFDLLRRTKDKDVYIDPESDTDNGKPKLEVVSR